MPNGELTEPFTGCARPPDRDGPDRAPGGGGSGGQDALEAGRFRFHLVDLPLLGGALGLGGGHRPTLGDDELLDAGLGGHRLGFQAPHLGHDTLLLGLHRRDVFALGLQPGLGVCVVRPRVRQDCQRRTLRPDRGL